MFRVRWLLSILLGFLMVAPLALPGLYVFNAIPSVTAQTISSTGQLFGVTSSGSFVFINPTTGVETATDVLPPLSPSLFGINGAVNSINNRFYYQNTTLSLASVDTTTGKFIGTVPLSAPLSLGIMGFDPTNRTLFGVTSCCALSPQSTFVFINPTTGVVTAADRVAAATDRDPVGWNGAVDPIHHLLYFENFPFSNNPPAPYLASLTSVDTTMGRFIGTVTLTGFVPYGPAIFDFGFDNVNGTLFGLAQGPSSSLAFSFIDPITGFSTATNVVAGPVLFGPDTVDSINHRFYYEYAPLGAPSQVSLASVNTTTGTLIGTVPLTAGLRYLGLSAGGCSSILQGALKPIDVLVIGGTNITARFQPNFGMTLAQAASACHYIGFDWRQTVTSWPNPSALFQVGNPLPLIAPPGFLDPPLGGYPYCVNGYPNHPSENCKNNFPFYYSQTNLTTGCAEFFQNGPCAVHIESADGTTLHFFDAPADGCLPGGNLILQALNDCLGDPPGSRLAFSTELMGILPNFAPTDTGDCLKLGTCVDLLQGFTWIDTFNGTNGGIIVTTSDTPVDPGTGTGGILILSFNGVPLPQPCVTTTVLGATVLDCEVSPGQSVMWPLQITANTLNVNLSNPNSGILVLSGSDNQQTSTNVTAGMLNVTTRDALGPDSGSLTLGGTQSNGTLTGGTLQISANSFSWGGTVATLGGGGTILVDTGQSATLWGPVADNSGLTVGDAIHGGQLTLSGGVGGAGGLTVNGGALSLSGINTYQGNTFVNNGTLMLTGQILNSSDSFIGQTAGSNGAATVTGPGSWTVSSGNLVVGEAGQGLLSITNGGLLSVTNPSNQIIIGDQSGSAGMVIVTGAGSQLMAAGSITVGNLGQGTLLITDRGTVLAADSNITVGPLGQVILSNGTLHPTGQGSVMVQAGGLLTGNGTIMGAGLTNNGTVAPGGTGQTLSVKGEYTQGTAGTLAIEANPTTASSLAVNKSATLGGTLALTFDPGAYAPSTTYTLVTAKQGLSGTFGAQTQSGASLGLLTPNISYTTTQVNMGFRLAPLTSFAATSNQLAVASALQQPLQNATSGDLLTVFNALNYSTPAQLRAVFSAMAGTAYAGLANLTIGTLSAATATIFGHWDGSGPGPAGARMLPIISLGGSEWTANGVNNWPSVVRPLTAAQENAGTSAFGGLSISNGDYAVMPTSSGFWTQQLNGTVGLAGWGDSLAAASAQTSGFLMGYDSILSSNLRIGTAIGLWQSGTVMTDTTAQSAGVATGLFAAYAQYSVGDWSVDALAGYASDTATVARPLPFVGRFAGTGYTANDTMAAVQVGRRFQWGGITLVPTIGLDYVQTDLPPMTESGAGALNLSVAGQTVTSVRGVIGMRLASPNTDGHFGWSAYVNYGHEFGATQFITTATLAGAPGNPFTVTGTSGAADAWGAGVQLNLKPWDGAEFHLSYDALMSAPQISQAGSVTLDLHF